MTRHIVSNIGSGQLIKYGFATLMNEEGIDRNKLKEQAVKDLEFKFLLEQKTILETTLEVW